MRALRAALLLVPLLAHAETAPLHPNDFAYGMTLQGDGAGALYTLEVPDEVYRYAVRPDLGDLRIFNNNGEVVPHLLRHETAGEEVRQTVTLPFYPLFADELAVPGETLLRIVPGEQGAVIDLRSPAAREAKERKVSHYLIDASALKQPIRRLTLRWQAPAQTFISTVVVEQSRDLEHWHDLASGSLAELLYGNDRLQRNELALPPAQQRYLRISWPLGARGITLSGVEAEVAQPGAAPALKWREATNLSGDGTPGRYEFETNGHYPVERLQVVLPQENTMVKATLSSRADAQSERWLVRYQGVLYALRHEGVHIDAGELAITPTSDRYWRLDVAQEGGGIGAGVPQLKLGWHPHQLIYVARGASPFTLAFGSARATLLTQDQGLSGWLASRHEVAMKTALPQALHPLGGEQALRPLPPPLPWKKWLLWTVLVAGVLAMLGMARSLYRQMNRA